MRFFKIKLNLNKMTNVHGKKLKHCSKRPLTGFLRDGFCHTDENDHGTHIVCAVVTEEFLRFTYNQGNDLITPRAGFPGLIPGDRWCLCVLRWIEAYKNNVAPFIDLNCTSKNVLSYVPFPILMQFSI